MSHGHSGSRNAHGEALAWAVAVLVVIHVARLIIAWWQRRA